MKHKQKVPLVKQLTQTECGLCCCVMLLKYYNSKETLKEVQEELDIGRDGMSVSNIKSFFVSKGFDCCIYKVTDVMNLTNIKEPFIAFWEEKHYVVVEKHKKNKWYVNDPGEGRRVLSDNEFIQGFSDIVLTMKPTFLFQPKEKVKYNPWVDTFKILLQQKWIMLQLVVFLALSYGLTFIVPMLVQKLIDKTMISEGVGYLKVFQLITLLGCVLYFSIIIIRGLKLVALNVSLGKSLEAKTFKHMLNLNYKFFEIRSSGDLLFRLNSTSGVKELIASQVLNGMIDVGLACVIFCYMVNKSILLTIISLSVFILNFMVMMFIQPKLSHAINNELTEKTKSQSLQVEALYSIESIKIACMEEEIYENWSERYKQVIGAFIKRMKINNACSSITSTIQLFAPIVILILGIYQYRKGNMTIGQVFAFQTISSTFFGLSTNIFNTYTQFLLASEYLERISDIWYTKPQGKSKKSLTKELEGAIRLEHISYSYSKNSKKVLKDISLEIEAGSKVAIVGSSGAGKSTLSKLLVGLYEPTEGEILFDSIPFRDYDKKVLCSQMGIVPQDALLFNKSIFENIVMNRENITMEEVVNVAQITCIHEEIVAMPMGYNTVVSEMGLNLSGGQRQRILLARALIQSPRILILDEATSSLDYVKEKAISEYLSQRGVTRVIIAHRLSTIIDADCIYVFSNGEITEKGTHEELLELNGEYAALYSSGITERKKEKAKSQASA